MEQPPTAPPQKVTVVKSSIAGIGWKNRYKQPLLKLVNNVNVIVTHTYFFLKFIFISELETNNLFNLEDFINDDFFREVFMSLISAYKPEKRKKTEKLEAYKTIINKHRENYIAISSYKPIDLKYAQQIANYEVVKIRTAYINNVTFNFGNKLRNLINILTNKKGRLTTINNDETKDASSKKESRNKVFEDIKKVKSAVSSRKMEDLPLDENSMTILKNILDSYSQDYQFDKDSIYYDCKANPAKHFKAYYIIVKTIESLQDSRFIICFPTRTTFIPCYITLDTIILNTQILKNKVITHLDKQVVWGAVLNLNSKAIKSSPINQVSFKGTIYTDGVDVSVLKQNYDPGRRRMGGGAIKKKTAEEEEEFRYVEDLTKDELLADVGKCVLVDPGRRDLLYCMHENSTTDNKLVYRYTSNQRNARRKLKKFAKLRERLKPKEVAESKVSC